jgi:hypothetical protein
MLAIMQAHRDRATCLSEFSRSAIAQEAGVTPQYVSMLIGPEYRAAAEGLDGKRMSTDTSLQQALEENHSRVIEIDPTTGEVVWSYEETPPIAFFSPIISNAQRLWNGNTLINDGASGRLFEVTAEGELVWEYINPYFSGPTTRDQQNSVFRAYRYPSDHIARAMDRAGGNAGDAELST